MQIDEIRQYVLTNSKFCGRIISYIWDVCIPIYFHNITMLIVLLFLQDTSQC